ncbi:hypothetical protein M3J09_009652 [Ascochyta lentis]
MRTSLSCSACRKSKIKCEHLGHPPCRRCDRIGITDCMLTRPRSLGVKQRVTRRNQEVPQDALSQQPVSTPPLSISSTTDPLSRGPYQPCSSRNQSINQHISSLSKKITLKALHNLNCKFLELPFIHVATFVGGIESAVPTHEKKVLIGAILAIIKLQPAVGTDSWAENLLPSAEYANYVREELSVSMLGTPKIEVVQALLIMCLHDWGCKEFHRAWVYCGIAIRIMQSIHSLRVAPYPLEPSLNSDCYDFNRITLAVENRTYWACFIMDCMINAGTYNPPMLPMSEMEKLKASRPLDAMQFALGYESPDTDSSLFCDKPAGLNGIHGTEILVGGFSIWTQIMSFVFQDGRKAFGMCSPSNCPWVPGSPWSNICTNLRDWRAKQHSTLHYPSASVAMHTMLGYGETFTYLNLLYFVSILVHYREYIPFLPAPDAIPVGPVDHPLLEAQAPAGWWDESSAEIFGAAEHIARILEEASDAGVLMMTPFIGFCAFSAGYMCAYVRWFPKMNLNRSPAAEECLNICLDFLEDFRHVWIIAEGWIKTIQHASILYERAATMDCYRGRSRADFDTLHQSMNEFRAVDRSDQYSIEIDGATQNTTEPTSTGLMGLAHMGDEDPSSASVLLTEFLAEVGSSLNEQGAWSNWWPQIE